MPIRAVIWDMGGVIVRTEDYTPRQGLADRCKLDRLALEEVVFAHPPQRGEIASLAHWQAVQARLDLQSEPLESIQNAFWGGDRADPVLVDYIHHLRPRYRTALLSNAFSDLRQRLPVEWPELEGAFDVIVVSAEEGIMKPDPRIYTLTLERLGVAAKEAVFIDDFYHNIEAAQKLGLHTVWFRNRDQTLAELDAWLEVKNG